MNNGTRPQDQAARASGGSGGAKSSAANPARATAATSSSSLTVDGYVHAGPDQHAKAGRAATAPAGAKKQKVCCACGKDVAHEERFKDRAGYYWCMDCGVQENRTKHAIAHPTEPATVTCPDCAQPFPPAQLADHGGARVCPGCGEKRDKAAKREAARKAAIAEAAADAERHRRRLLIGAAIAAVLAVALAVYVMAF